jgi:hypothetical protein
MRVHQYDNYTAYLAAQRAATTRKRRNQWCTEEDMAYLAKMLVRRGLPTASVLCHGTRSGLEQKWMLKHLRENGAEPFMVIGSELVPDVALRGRVDPATFSHDFNFCKPDWVGRFSVVYSNSFDHAFNPVDTLRMWAAQLHPGGTIVLEHTRFHTRTGPTDPTGGTLAEYRELIAECGLVLVDTLQYMAPGSDEFKNYLLIRNPKP